MKVLINVLALVLLAGCATADLSLKSGFKKETVKNVAISNFSTPADSNGEKFGKMAADMFAKELPKMGFTVVEARGEMIVTGDIRPALKDGRLVIPRKVFKKKNTAEKPQQFTTLEVKVQMTRADTGEILWLSRAESTGISTEASVRQSVKLILKRLKKSLSSSPNVSIGDPSP